MTRVRVEIGELALHGFPERDVPALASALRECLGVLLSGDVPEFSGVDRVDAGTFHPGVTPEATGARIASAVYRGLSR